MLEIILSIILIPLAICAAIFVVAFGIGVIKWIINCLKK